MDDKKQPLQKSSVDITRKPGDLEKQSNAVIIAYRKVFDTEHGRQVLDDLKKRCYFINSTFDVNALCMAHKSGKHDVLLHIMNMLQRKLEEIPDSIT